MIIRVVSLIVMGSLTFATYSAEHDQRRGQTRDAIIEGCLARLVAENGDLTSFCLTYSDLHALHGGLSLTINGNGKVQQDAVNEPIGQPRTLTPTEVRQLIALLLKHNAWLQRATAPLNEPRAPDESRAELTIVCGDESVTVWELFNDLASNQQLIVIREAMKRMAWQREPQDCALPAREVVVIRSRLRCHFSRLRSWPCF